MTVSKRMRNSASTINLQRIGHVGRRMKKEQLMLHPTARTTDAKAKEKLRRETFSGRLDRTINYAKEQPNSPCTNMLAGKGRRHGTA